VNKKTTSSEKTEPNHKKPDVLAAVTSADDKNNNNNSQANKDKNNKNGGSGGTAAQPMDKDGEKCEYCERRSHTENDCWCKDDDHPSAEEIRLFAAGETTPLNSSNGTVHQGSKQPATAGTVSAFTAYNAMRDDLVVLTMAIDEANDKGDIAANETR